MVSSVNTADINRLSMPPDSADEETDVLLPTGDYKETTHTESKTADVGTRTFAKFTDYFPENVDLKKYDSKKFIEMFENVSLDCFKLPLDLKAFASIKKQRNKTYVAILEKLINALQREELDIDHIHKDSRFLIEDWIFTGQEKLLNESLGVLGPTVLEKELTKSESTRFITMQKESKAHLELMRDKILSLCEGSGLSPISPGSRNERAYDRLSNAKDWVKTIMQKVSIKSRSFFYNLNHIYNGDSTGGMHIRRSEIEYTQEFAKNEQTQIINSEIKCGDVKKISTFFPPFITSKTALIDLLSKSDIVGGNNGNQYLSIVAKEHLGEDCTEDLYIMTYMEKDMIRAKTTFPILKMFEYDKILSVNKFSLTVKEVEISLIIAGDLPDTCVLFCTTERYKYYDVSTVFKGVKVFIKVPQ